MEVLCVLPDGTVLHVVLFGVLKAEFEVQSDCIEVRILPGL